MNILKSTARVIVLVLISIQVDPTYRALAAEDLGGEKFRGKLSEMLQKTEKSVKILSEQIAQSQNAPFLGDLYMQLADLYTEKSNTLYYIQMERFHDNDISKGSDKEFSPVISAQKEAIGVYHLLLKDFDKYEKKGQVLYRLAVALKSIDDTTEFVQIAGQLIRKYPSNKETVGVRLMLAQYYFDKQEFKDARDLLIPAANSKYVYERDLAKYRIGLIDITEERCKQAMSQFEQVITDADLKEQENPYNVELKARSAKKSDLKREALIDSIRCFTRLPEINKDPVGYYSKTAPSEIHFQEVIEKLALRYIYLKRYAEAIVLLRTLSERTADPQKVVNIYRDVLTSIPPKERIAIPVDEVRFLLERYNLWASYFKLSPDTSRDVFSFFEKQVRELATTSHDLAKVERSEKLKATYLARARDFYNIYLGFFGKTKYTVEMAINLADVYFLTRDYMQSGDFYLRAFQGVYGQSTAKKNLIENALFALQKKNEVPFYDKIRTHGLLIEAVKSYMAFDRTKANSPDVNFVLVKARYEQGFFPGVLDELLAFMRRFNGTKQCSNAGELILDYFNTRNDFDGLRLWTSRMQGIGLRDRAFLDRLKQVGKVAQSKVAQEKIRSMAGYDDFNQGKSYLTLALSSGDSNLANSALKEALAKSRRERDIQTFLKVAEVMAQKEKNPDRKAEILNSISHEQNQITEYYKSLGSLKNSYNNQALTRKARVGAFEEAINTSLLLKDWIVLGELLRNSLTSDITSPTRQRIKEQYADLLESPIPISSDLERSMSRVGGANTPEALLSAYKGRVKLTSNVSAQISQQVAQTCGGGGAAPVCRWKGLEAADAKKIAVKTELARAGTAVTEVEAHAQKFMALLGDYKALENSGDISLETTLTLRNYELYTAFQQYLERVANANPAVRPVLLQKAKETQSTAAQYRQRCSQIAAANDVFDPARRFCARGVAPAIPEIFRMTNQASFTNSPRNDSTSDVVTRNERTIFAKGDAEKAFIELAKEYFNSGYYHHAAAVSAYGASLYKSSGDSFETIWGCSVAKLGLLNEARYHLKKGTSLDGMSEQCLSSLKQTEAAL